MNPYWEYGMIQNTLNLHLTPYCQGLVIQKKKIVIVIWVCKLKLMRLRFWQMSYLGL